MRIGLRADLSRSRNVLNLTVECDQLARVAKLADARDLKSRVLKGTYRFDSGPGHHATLASSLFALVPAQHQVRLKASPAFLNCQKNPRLKSPPFVHPAMIESVHEL